MKVVQAVGWYYPHTAGGTEVYVSSLTRVLRAAGHEVSIAAPRAGSASAETYLHDGVEVFRYPIPSTPSRAEVQGLAPVRGAGEFSRWLSAIRPDVVHVHTFVTGLGLTEIAAARSAGARVIATTHSSSLGFLCQRGTLMLHGASLCDGRVEGQRCAACALGHSGAPRLLAAALARIPTRVSRPIGRIPGPLGTAIGMRALISSNRSRQSRMFQLIDRFVVLTEHAASIVRTNGAPAGTVNINRLGVAREFLDHPSEPHMRGASICVGYLGRFEPVKGVLDFAAAIRALPRDLPISIEFRGPVNSAEDRRVVDLIRSTSGDDPRVTIGDAVAPGDVGRVLSRFDVACFPSRCLEGGPTAGLEALAVGTPVIAASVGGLAEVLDDGVNTRLVPPGDVTALRAALVEVASNPTGTIDRWRAQLPRVRSMDEVAADYLEDYERRW